MDPGDAFRWLTDYGALVQQAQKQPILSKERRATIKALNERLPTVNLILQSLAPDIPLISAHYLSDHAAAWPNVRRALGGRLPRPLLAARAAGGRG